MAAISQEINVLVHLGAGHCSELESYLAMQPKQLLLVEADSQLIDSLLARTTNLPQVQVVCAAVAGCPGPAVLHRYNLPGASSLHKASGLKQFFPGLKTTEDIKIEAIRPEALIQPLLLTTQQNNLLVIDLPGEELPVLQALQESQLLHMFRKLYLNCGSDPLYEGSVAAHDILHWLQEHGYDLLEENDQQDPARPCYTLRINKLKLENMDLHTQIKQLTKDRDEQAHWHQENRKWALALEAEKKALESQVAELTNKCDSNAQTVEEYRRLLEETTKDRDEQAHWHQENRKWALTLEANKQKLERIVAERDSQLNSLNDKFHQACQTASLATKMQLLREEDLRDLQKRYRELIITQDAQHKLLNQVEERLRVASHYFSHLRDNNLLSDITPDFPNNKKGRLTKQNKRKVDLVV